MSDNRHLPFHLKNYLEKGRSETTNTISHVQRVCRIGYANAIKVVEYGFEQGNLIDEGQEWKHTIKAGTSIQENKNDY
jgi:hypothetical protein